MRKMLFLPAVICGILASLTLGTGKAQAELGIIPGIGGDFTLTSHDDKPVSLSDFKGKVVLLFFGYTSCPDVCPTTMSMLETVRSKLGDKADQAQIILVSVDPERDTKEKLKTYVGYFDPSSIGLTGTPEEIAEVAKKYRMSYKKVPTADGTSYSVDHMDFIYLIDTQGRLRGLYRSSSPVEKLAGDTLSLM